MSLFSKKWSVPLNKDILEKRKVLLSRIKKKIIIERTPAVPDDFV